MCLCVCSALFCIRYQDVSQRVVFTQRSGKPGVEKDEARNRSASRRKSAPEKPLYPMGESLRKLVKHFAENLLVGGGYDILMDSIRPELMHGIGISRLEKEDYTRFFRLSCFCTSYMKLKMEKLGATELHEKYVHFPLSLPLSLSLSRSLSVSDVRRPGRMREKGPNDGKIHDSSEWQLIALCACLFNQRNRYHAPNVSPFREVSATMGWDMFHLLLTVWQQQIEIPVRAEEKDWDLQSSSLALLKEMMYVFSTLPPFPLSLSPLSLPDFR